MRLPLGTACRGRRLSFASCRSDRQGRSCMASKSTREMQMMKLRESVSAVVVMCAVLGALAGCQKQEGPAERAGKEADKAVEKVGQQIEKAGESLQDTAKGHKK